MKKIIAILSAVIIAVSFAACGAKTDNTPTDASTAPAASDSAAVQNNQTEAPEEPATIADGYTTFGDKSDYTHAFYLEVISKDGTDKKYGIYTKENTLGAALSGMGIIKGETGDYGLMVESVFGEEHIYETSGYVWMIYVNGEQAQTGVDSINLESGATYTFKVETF